MGIWPCCSAGGADEGLRRRLSRNRPLLLTRGSPHGAPLSPARAGAGVTQAAEKLTTAGIDGTSVLEIGCGISELQRRVLAAGAAGAVGIDVPDGMTDGARAAAERGRLQARTTLSELPS